MNVIWGASFFVFVILRLFEKWEHDKNHILNVT